VAGWGAIAFTSPPMSLPLESLELETFQPLLETTFVLSISGDAGCSLTLIEARSLGHRRADATREPFALTFRGPAGLRIPQAIHPISHPVAGQLEIFLVQVADKPDGSLFEAIFT